MHMVNGLQDDCHAPPGPQVSRVGCRPRLP
jgi:hypothetical protein